MYIYKTTNLINGKIYIGLSTKTVEESIGYYGSGKLISKALKKWGKENFTKEIIESGIDDYETLCKLEIYYIEYYNSINEGYNITRGGGGTIGHKHTKEAKQKISNYLSNQPKEVLEKRASSNTGKVRSEDVKRRTSQSMKGKTYTEERRQNMSKNMLGKSKKIRTTTCPHCGKSGGASLMTRYHFQNCKNKI